MKQYVAVYVGKGPIDQVALLAELSANNQVTVQEGLNFVLEAPKRPTLDPTKWTVRDYTEEDDELGDW